MEMVKVVPVAIDVFMTFTSLVPLNVPVPIVVDPAFMDTLPAVPLKPPRLAVAPVNSTAEAMVSVNVILLAGLLLEPIWEYAPPDPKRNPLLRIQH